MESLDTISVTTSCFVHKPSKQKKKSTNYSLSLYHDTEFPIWKEISSKIKIIEKKAYTETFDGILNFIGSSLKIPLKDSNEVPAAVLLMGVNMSDHSHIFYFLETYLNLNDIYTTVILESKKAHSFSSIVQTIYSELVNKYEQFLNIEDSLPKKQDYSFEKLYECYQSLLNRLNGKGSPRKRTPKKKQSVADASTMPIVLLIQDVENFNSELLQKLVLICKLYSDKLPILLIFGMASAMVSLHSILPQNAYSCLELETFNFVPATEYLTRIIDEVVISPVQPFKLGPKVFKLVIDSVLYHDFSISNLTYFLRFCVIEHLHGNKLASLCCHESEVSERVHDLQNEDLQAIRSLPSLKLFFENNPNFLSGMNKPSNLKEFIISQIQMLFHDQKVNIILLKLLQSFVKDLPHQPLGKHLRELYSLSLEREISLSPEYLAAEKLLKMQSQENLLSKLKTGLSILKTAEADFDSSIIKDACQKLEECLEKLSKLQTSDLEKTIPDPLSFQTEKITSRFQLQERIQLSLKQKRSNYEALRNEIMESLLSIFKYIKTPSSFPLSEIFYFDNISSVKQHLVPVPRAKLSYALINPQHYFKCNCCKISLPEETQASMPDISILYKLHLESGKLINLRDWLEAFKSIKNNEGILPKRSKSKVKENDTELNLRFLQAVSELQLLGFIKSTKRKTDHVARLTFGTF